MFSDRYEMHIQDFGDFIYAIESSSDHRFHKKYKTDVLNIQKKRCSHNFKTTQIKQTKIRGTRNSKECTWDFRKQNEHTNDSQIYTTYLSRMFPCGSCFVYGILVINMGSEGPDLITFLVDPKMF